MWSVTRDSRLTATGVAFSGLLVEVEIEVFDLAGQVAAEVSFDTGAGRPARLCPVVVEAEADGSNVGIAAAVEEAEPRNDAGRLDLGKRKPAGEIRHGLRRDGRAEAAAHRAEPIQCLRAVEARGEVADARIADGAGTNEGRGGVLRRKLDVGLDAGDKPTARHPVIAALKAGDHAVEIVRGTGGEQRR